MTKPFVLITLACLAAFDGLAQTKSASAQPPGTLTVSFGPSFPVGAFASKNGNELSSGLANAGELAALDWWQPISKSPFGMIASIRFAMNGVDSKATLEPLEESEPTYQWSMKKSHWSSGAILVGGYYQLPLTRRLDLRVNLEVGAALCYLPAQSVTGVHDSAGVGAVDLIQANVGKAHAVTLTALAGAGLSYHLTPHYSLLLHAGYSYLDPSFQNVHRTVYFAQGLIVPGDLSLSNAASLSVFSETRSYTQAMSSVGVTVGFGYSW